APRQAGGQTLVQRIPGRHRRPRRTARRASRRRSHRLGCLGLGLRLHTLEPSSHPLPRDESTSGLPSDEKCSAPADSHLLGVIPALAATSTSGPRAALYPCSSTHAELAGPLLFWPCAGVSDGDRRTAASENSAIPVEAIAVGGDAVAERGTRRSGHVVVAT